MEWDTTAVNYTISEWSDEQISLYPTFMQNHKSLTINKKSELMLTRRTKAYSSFCSQTVSLSSAISLQLLWGYRF